MSSQDPPDGKKHGLRKTIKSGAKWFKKATGRPSNSRSESGQTGHLTAPSFGSLAQSISQPTTPTLTPGLLPPEADRRVITPPPGPPTQDPVPVPEPEVPALLEQKDPKIVTWDRLKSSLSAFEGSMGLFPPLKSAIGALIGSLDVVQTAALNRTDYEELVEEFQSMADALKKHAGELHSESSNGSIANIAQCIQQQVAAIEQQDKRGTIGKLLDGTHDQEDVIQRYRQVDRLFRQLQCDLSMRTVSAAEKHFESSLLRGMSPVDDARYNSSYSMTIQRHGCTAETREAIHKALQDWTTNPDSEKIYWMNGMAGTGKTTIAYSLCEWLENTNRLGASFFCSRISSKCRSLSRIIPTLAYQLARYSPAFRFTLCAALKDNPDAGTLNVGQQFEKLINQPMLKAKDAVPESVVIVIDALDECDDGYSVRLLLDVLLKFAEHLPLKFFVASRPEHAIRERMMSQGGASRSIVHLHDIEQAIVEGDIKKYLTEALGSMTPPPSSKQVEVLAKRAGKLFIYAATVVRYINPEVIPVESSARLEMILMEMKDPELEGDDIYEDLDRLYTTVLNAVNQSLGRRGQERVRRVLWTVVCAREPIPTATLASLATLTESQVWSALQSLRSVLHVPENNGLISTLHASFPEYMLDSSRSKELHCNELESNKTLIGRCFKAMQSELRFNMCNIKSSYLTNDKVVGLETLVAECISPTLSYACRYWGQHLSLSPALANTRDMLLEFLCNRLLFWMEVLSLSGCIGIGAPMMQQAQTWLRQVEGSQDTIQKQIADVRNFTTWFAANPCSHSTPHIYVSALPLCIKSNWVYQHYWERTKGLANVTMSQWDEAVLAIWTTESRMWSMAISPDGDRIAAGGDNGNIYVYDIHTGAIISGPFKGHTAYVSSLALSPDGTHIVSCSMDKTVIIWDSHSGNIVAGPLHQHKSVVWSVAFSPDGNRVVSGSADESVIVWDIHSGHIILGPLKEHTGRILSVAFSPDSQLIASGSADHTIILWDAYTGTAKAKPFRGHNDQVTRVVFSPDGRHLASCSSDKTIRVWDIQTGTIIGQPFEGHKDRIWCIAFSADGSYIISGGENTSTIVVWETHTGSVVLGPLHGHTNQITSVGFLPDGSRVVSCSRDKTIRIWDIQSKDGHTSRPNAHEMSFGPIAFSLNHTQFISNSSNGALRLWDTHTGTPTSRPFVGQAQLESIHSVACSSQGSYVAVAANDLTIRVWNMLTGIMISQHNKHKNAVRCLVFSPDGTHICSGSDDGTIIVWDIENDTMVGRPYEGHTGSVRSIAYSPDGTHIASGGTDYTVRVWELSSGTLLHTLSKHEYWVLSVAFSPDGRYIAAGGSDCTVWMWNTQDYSNPVSGSYYHPVNSVCFSPDGTRVIAGCGYTVYILNTQTMEIISELNLPWEEVQWVGYSPDGADVISVSISKSDTRQRTEEPAQQPLQNPNIIRVWRPGTRPDQTASSSTPCDWSYELDGRILSPEGFVMWVPPDLVPYFKPKHESKPYYNPLVISSDGIIDIGYRDLCIGDRWTECYIQKD